MGQRKTWAQADRSSKGLNRCLCFALTSQHQPQVVSCQSQGRIHRQRLLESGLGLVQMSLVHLIDSLGVQCGRLFRLTPILFRLLNFVEKALCLLDLTLGLQQLCQSITGLDQLWIQANRSTVGFLRLPISVLALVEGSQLGVRFRYCRLDPNGLFQMRGRL